MDELKLRGRVWWARYYRDGRRYEGSSGPSLQRVARELLKNREGDVAKGAPITPKVAG